MEQQGIPVWDLPKDCNECKYCHINRYKVCMCKHCVFNMKCSCDNWVEDNRWIDGNRSNSNNIILGSNSGYELVCECIHYKVDWVKELKYGL